MTGPVLWLNQAEAVQETATVRVVTLFVSHDRNAWSEW